VIPAQFPWQLTCQLKIPSTACQSCCPHRFQRGATATEWSRRDECVLCKLCTLSRRAGRGDFVAHGRRWCWHRWM